MHIPARGSSFTAGKVWPEVVRCDRLKRTRNLKGGVAKIFVGIFDGILKNRKNYT